MPSREPHVNNRMPPVREITWGEQVWQEFRHPSRTTLLRVGIAALMVIVAIYTNRQFLGWGLFATLAVLFVPLGRARAFLAAFVPYAAIWFIFTFLRSLADETILAKTVNTTASQIERWIFNGELPTVRLQAALYDPFHLHWWDFYLTFVHWSYFLIPHAVAVFLWWKYPARFLRYLRAMTLLLTLGLVIYFALPSNPPWLAPEALNTPGAPTVLRIMEPIANEIGGAIYKAGYRIVGESNPIAAMPSIHMAITFLMVMVARYFGRWWRIASWLYAISMGIALVYLGEHYVIDVVVGVLITAYSWHAAGGWLSRILPTRLRRLIVWHTPGPIAPRRNPPRPQPAGTNV